MSIRGKKREEYVKEWLDGKENPDIEVIPTKVEGKYIVRERVKNKSAEIKDEKSETASRLRTSSETEAEKSENNNTPENNVHENNIPINNVPESNVPVNNVPEPNISLEILAQLKMLNEYKMKKLEKKEKKKEIKKVVRKEFVKNKVLVEDSDDDDVVSIPPEPQKIYVQKPPPLRVRRRVNLLDRYK